MTPAHRRTGVVLAVLAMCAPLAACAADQTPAAPVSSAPPPPPQAVTRTLAAADCAATAPSGRIVRSGYDLRYSAGSMRVAVATAGRPARCVEFSKSGRADPNVPPDTLLFTFAGGRGEGAQLEFLAVDLAGGVLPWPVGASARTPGSPITATVGVSVGGAFYRSDSCTLTLTMANETKAAGRFECPAALTQAENPMDPNDDVSYDEPSAPAAPGAPIPPAAAAPATATLSGLFTISK
ncbi:MAG: hypothetical protein WBA05_08175 [Gordonia sp. (in: high G+C Gram-positive bacteria)]|uniref:hypothetical protein n=1 Tax=Gordonia sp. (in: high G+C Gram-positive bacteria) TaxID=84139 RepID=UPI003C7228DD